MIWVSWLMALTVFRGFIAYGNKPPETALRPWTRVGADAHAWIVNVSPDTLLVLAQAPQVDHATRLLGVIPPGDSIYVKLPYVDTDVTFRFAQFTGFGVAPITNPGVYRLAIR